MFNYNVRVSLILILFSILLVSCSNSFDSDKWKVKGKEYEREELTETLCKKYLKRGDKREKIISLLGESVIKCDSTNQVYGAFQKRVPYEKSNELIVINEEKYHALIHSKCSDSLTIDRYYTNENGSGPDYLALCYDKENNLLEIFFERTEH
jgi:hypothetical protein